MSNQSTIELAKALKGILDCHIRSITTEAWEYAQTVLDNACSCEPRSPDDQCPIHGYEAWKRQKAEAEDCPRCGGDPDGVCHHQTDDFIPIDDAAEAAANQGHRW